MLDSVVVLKPRCHSRWWPFPEAHRQWQQFRAICLPVWRTWWPPMWLSRKPISKCPIEMFQSKEKQCRLHLRGSFHHRHRPEWDSPVRCSFPAPFHMSFWVEQVPRTSAKRIRSDTMPFFFRVVTICRTSLCSFLFVRALQNYFYPRKRSLNGFTSIRSIILTHSSLFSCNKSRFCVSGWTFEEKGDSFRGWKWVFDDAVEKNGNALKKYEPNNTAK